MKKLLLQWKKEPNFLNISIIIDVYVNVSVSLKFFKHIVKKKS